MQAGDTFYLPHQAADGHLWVILSDPVLNADRVLFVSMTSYNIDKEAVCLIQAGEHPRVTQQTCINYQITRHATLASLNQLRDSGVIRVQPPVSVELLGRIRIGTALSRRIAFEHIELLDEQGLLD